MGRFSCGLARGDPNCTPPPPPSRLTHSLSRACAFPEVCARICPGRGATAATPSPPQTYTHGHSSPPLLRSLGYPKNRPVSGKVIRFKGPGLEMGAEARGNRDDGRAAKGFSRTAPPSPQQTHPSPPTREGSPRIL